jgi:hypothetical protein
VSGEIGDSAPVARSFSPGLRNEELGRLYLTLSGEYTVRLGVSIAGLGESRLANLARG